MPYGDFSLNPFAERPNTARVLMQQGRVLLDSDWNAQVATSMSMLRRLALSILGRWAASGDAFKVAGTGNAMTIASGTFWVNGLPCWNGPNVTMATQPAYNGLEKLPPQMPAPFALIYLDAWEQTVSVHEDESLREIALGGADTTLRSEIHWAVRALPLTEQQMTPFREKASANSTAKAKAAIAALEPLLPTLFAPLESTITLAAEAAKHDTTDACLVAPDAKYRGVENQLYRVEVYRGTHDAFGDEITDDKGTPLPALLVWSRDNGSVTLPVSTVDGRSITVTSLGQDDRTRLQPGNVVQLVDRYDSATGRPRRLRKVTDVSDYRNLITLDDAIESPKFEPPAILRRWDGGPHEVALKSNEMELDLENDIVINLAVTPGQPPRLHTGDYWIIPARTTLGDVIWPRDSTGKLEHLLPHGVTHHYAPLAAVGGPPGIIDVRTVIVKPVEMA
jgi:Family of unknown function (DUF6519)